MQWHGQLQQPKRGLIIKQRMKKKLDKMFIAKLILNNEVLSLDSIG